jgi:sodium transport system permease protein
MSPQLLWVVLSKELLDGVRDRRSMVGLFLASMMIPAVFGTILTLAAGHQRDAERLALPIAGAEYAPAFVGWLRQQPGVEVLTAPPNHEQAVIDRREDVVLVIEQEFADAWSRAMPAPVTLLSNSTRDSTRTKSARIRTLVGAYSSEQASLRLMARGVAPGLTTPVRLDEVEVASAQQRIGQLLIFLPVLLASVAMIGGIPMAIDSTAGERERGSLEPLLLNPVSRPTLVLGKWLSASSFAAGCILIASATLAVIFGRIPWHEMGVRIRLEDQDLWNLFIVMLPLALLMSAIVMALSTLSRSFKEAQGYVGFLLLIPTLPGLVSMFYPLANRAWLAPVPVLGQFAVASDVLAGNGLAAQAFLASALGAVTAAVALVALTARLLRRESIVFGT